MTGIILLIACILTGISLGLLIVALVNWKVNIDGLHGHEIDQEFTTYQDEHRNHN